MSGRHEATAHGTRRLLRSRNLDWDRDGRQTLGQMTASPTFITNAFGGGVVGSTDLGQATWLASAMVVATDLTVLISDSFPSQPSADPRR